MKRSRIYGLPFRSGWSDRLLKSIGLLTAVWCVAAAAQNSPSLEQSTGTRFVTLGTQGGPLPAGHRAQPANALVVRGRVYLIDAGNGVVQQLRLAGIDYRRINQIFISHNHDDHNADWGTLMGLQWSTGRRKEVNVYGPVGTESMLQGYLRYFEPNARIRESDAKIAETPESLFRAHDIGSPGIVYQDDLVKVTAIENCHFHFEHGTPADVAQDKSWAFRFETADRVVVYSGDTGKCADMVNFARDADVLVHEVISLPLIEDSLKKFMASQPGKSPAGLLQGLMRHMAEDHTDPEDIGRLAQAANVKEVVLTHVVPGRDTDPDSAYTDGVSKFYKGPVTLARDLMEF
ncbi:MBL fold metallo-hydrolase [Paraburkholderia sp. A1RO-5L]|uniref:MBL fold metallo-hydrolase n=1 Tax=unclassified Paraburkholderia TaxID=2615204 RepID=UPI003B97D0F1